MKIIDLSIKNFLAIGEAHIPLNDRGLCLIQGENLDDTSAGSNGAGKSSIVNALSWCLYGVASNGVTGDAVVNNVAKKNTRVATNIKDGATTYTVERYRKDSTHKNQLRVTAKTDGVAAIVDMTKGTERETQEVVNQIMGCSLEVFMAAIYAGQEAMPDIPKMTDKQLKLLIEEAAGVDRLESAYVIAREKLNEIKVALTKSVATEESYKTQITNVLKNKKMVSEQHDKFEADRKEKSKQSKKYADLCELDINDYKAKLSPYCESVIKARIAELDKEIRSHDEKLKELDAVSEGLKKHEQAFTKAEANYHNELKRVNELKERFTNAEDLVKHPCHACGKPGDEHDLKTFKEHTKDALVKQLQALQQAQKEMTTCDGIAQKERARRAEIASKIPNVSEITKERNALMENLSVVTRLKAEIATKETSRTAYLDAANGYLVEPNPHSVTLHSLNEDAARLGKLLKAAMVKSSELQEELDIYENAVKVFGPAGVRAHILDTVTPFLNDRTSDYLSALSDGNIGAVWSTLTTTGKGELKEKFNIEVTNEVGATSFAGLSGGEKRKVRLSTMLALQDLVSTRATKSLDVFFCDEIDHALDEKGLERLMVVLDRKAKERGTVLVISHNSLAEWIPNVITVTKKGGLSTISS